MKAERVIAILLFTAVAGCRDHRAPKDSPATAAGAAGGGREEHRDEQEHQTLPKRVQLPPEVVAAANIETSPIAKESLAVILTLPGEIAPDPDKSARIAAPVAGRLVRVDFKEGSQVEKGDVLATIRVPDAGKVRSAYNAASAKGAAARANADRLQVLSDKGLAAKQDALSAKAEADSLEAEARALGEQLSVLGMGASGAGSDIAVRAPVGGVVVMRDGVIGQPVTAEQTIASIADLSEVWFLARVFEKDLGRLALGAKVEIALNAYPKERFDGAVEYISRQIDPVARTLTARIRLQNRDERLRIGLFGMAQVAVSEESKRGPALVVPRTALTEIGGKSVVFVRQKDGDFEMHEVVPGEAALGKVEIVSGLREGENVVTKGVFSLKSVVLKSSIAEEE